MLSIEIVEYSQLAMDQQTRLLGRLVRIISQTAAFNNAQEGDQLIGLPTDDGMTLVFFGDPVAPVRCATEIGRGLQSYPEMKLRMGIHSGPVYRIAGIDSRANVSGEGIKTAQRIMAAGDAGHILVSKPVADTLGHLGNWAKCLTDLGERELTPGARLQVFNLYTGEVGNLDHPNAITATLIPSAKLPETSPPPVISKKVTPGKRVRSAFIVVLAVAAIAAVIGGYLILKREPQAVRPLLAAEFEETFKSFDRWEVPSNGWTFKNESLQIEDQKMIGYAKELNCGDFSMTFHLKLINDGGAAWVLRVKDPNNYYLFYLSGPGGTNPNTFFTYVVRDGKSAQKTANNLIVHLVAGGEYHIDIVATNNQITHKIRTDNTTAEFESEAGFTKNLGLFVDDENTYPTGSIGFRTYASEKFAVTALYVRPPGIQMPDEGK